MVLGVEFFVFFVVCDYFEVFDDCVYFFGDYGEGCIFYQIIVLGCVIEVVEYGDQVFGGFVFCLFDFDLLLFFGVVMVVGVFGLQVFEVVQQSGFEVGEYGVFCCGFVGLCCIKDVVDCQVIWGVVDRSFVCFFGSFCFGGVWVLWCGVGCLSI